MDGLIRGQPPVDEDAADAEPLSPAAQIAAGGGFDGGATSPRSTAPRDFGSTLDFEIRGALLERRERRVALGGGSPVGPSAPNGIR